MYDSWDIAVQDFNLAFVTTFHMPLFMLLSGFVIHAIPDYKKLTKKCYSFLLPFIVFGGIYSFVIHERLERIFISEFKLGYWYLFVLIIFYCLISLQKLTKTKTQEFIVSLIIYGLLNFAIFFLPRYFIDLFSLGLCRTLYPFFMLGYFTRKYNWLELLMKNNWLFTVALLSFIPVYLLFHNGIFNHLFKY